MQLHAVTYTYIHLQLHLHTLTYTCIHLHALTYTYIHLHTCFWLKFIGPMRLTFSRIRGSLSSFWLARSLLFAWEARTHVSQISIRAMRFLSQADVAGGLLFQVVKPKTSNHCCSDKALLWWQGIFSIFVWKLWSNTTAAPGCRVLTACQAHHLAWSGAGQVLQSNCNKGLLVHSESADEAYHSVQ